MSNNNNMLHTEAIANPQWSSFSDNNLLKTEWSAREMGPSYLLDLSTVLKYIEVRIMDASNCRKEAVCVHSKS